MKPTKSHHSAILELFVQGTWLILEKSKPLKSDLCIFLNRLRKMFVILGRLNFCTPRYCTFRFHFLPTDFDNNLLKNFFNAVRIDGLKIEQILDERYKDRPERNNGVRRIRISYPKEVDNIIGRLSGPTIMYGLKCVVSIVGQEQKCYFCDEEGHNIAKCPVKDSTCERCKQKGHLTQKCSIAEKLKSLERKKVDYSELFVKQEEIQSIHEQEQIDSEEISKPNTPVYQPDSYKSTDSNLVHLTGSQIHKTPVLKDYFRDVQKSYTQDILTPVQYWRTSSLKVSSNFSTFLDQHNYVWWKTCFVDFL
ncbi:hypothetical protein BpHYR1_018971 [Brachionus plicatilis]|uniref:CCHC-type domain-containing protein n=1 Tax=Brachionus plicatilis TaxID=10195 RepID=A0A3M7RF74_BRAPC|nr:hypothetical protein BpHYR1_018971 [Brachionus plicatilis]